MHPDFFEFPGVLTRAPSSRRSSQDTLAILFLLTINIKIQRRAMPLKSTTEVLGASSCSAQCTRTHVRTTKNKKRGELEISS